MIELRKWQEDFIPLPRLKYDDDKSNFLAHVGVGAGKTFATIKALEEFGNEFKYIIISPSENVKRNWCYSFKELTSKDIDWKYSFKYDFQNNFDGVSITYQALNDNNMSFLLRNNIIDEKTIIICDEIHHCGENKSWGWSVKNLCELAGFSIFLTGTPFREDEEKIPFVDYKDGKVELDYTYAYSKLVEDKVSCGITFEKEDVIFNNDKFKELDDSKVLNTVINITDDENKFIKNIFQRADNKLNDLRNLKYNTAGLVVCNTIADAKELQRIHPDAEIVTSDDPQGSVKIEEFKNNGKKWIISVNMISEGVDIPRLRVLVYLTNTTTRLFFEQVSGRITRNRNDEQMNGEDLAYFYYPSYSPLIEHAKNIENTYLRILKEQKEEREKREFKEREIGPREFLQGIIDSEEGSSITAGVEYEMAEKNEAYQFAKKNGISTIQIDQLKRILSKEKRDLYVEDKRTVMDNLGKKISKSVGYFQHLTGAEFKDIHFKLNKDTGMTSTRTATVSQLENKLKLIMKWIERER